MNRDEGAFLSGIYNPLFAGLRKFGGKSRVSELRVSDSQASCSDDVHSEVDQIVSFVRVRPGRVHIFPVPYVGKVRAAVIIIHGYYPRSIFKNQLRQEQIESEVPDLGTVLESWYFDVQKHGQLIVSSPMDVHIRPIDPQKYPEMNKLFINVLYMGNDKIRLSELQNLTKQYIVNLDVKEFNTDVSVSCTNTGEACVEQMEGQNVHVKTHKGDCLLKNIKGFNINVETKEGNIVGRKVLQGNLRLTSVDGSITADRVQGQVVECAGRHGNIQVKDVYADKSHFHTHHGNICLGSCHGNTQVTLDIGDLTVGSLDGNLSVKVGRGDSVVAMSREGNINMETGTGDVCVKVAESQKGKVSLTGTSIDPGKVALNNMQIEKADNITSVTGTLANLDSGKKEVKVKTGKGRISLEYYSWLASLNIFKDASS
ncbi:F185A-like protein [Mya arenaria]|uniref:F185A-like protein n=1 Tax=Mya arenaria TaxID=6604 RepID=A0ABY7FS38_MYAAR|nr:F185A-like protein [Mya arenaria]